jgi:hypothetical protein
MGPVTGIYELQVERIRLDRKRFEAGFRWPSTIVAVFVLLLVLSGISSGWQRIAHPWLWPLALCVTGGEAFWRWRIYRSIMNR